MRPLVFHRLLLRFALAGGSVFAWIILFHFFFLFGSGLVVAFVQTALLYALSSVITTLATPFTARLLRHGVRRTMVFAVLSLAGAFVVLGAAFEGFWGGAYTGAILALFASLFGLYRALYWIPYEVEAAAEALRRRSSFRGELLVALAPALAGLLIAAQPDAVVWLFYIGAGCVLLSLVPLFSVADVYENFSWGYRKTFHELLSREHRVYVTRAILEGVSGAALLLFWPLAVFLLLNWSYGMLGIVLSFTFLVAIFARVPVRGLLRRFKLHQSRLLTGVLALTPWFFRLAIATPVGVVLVDSYFYTTTPRRLGVDPFSFEQTSDGGSLLDEFTALKEMALNIGRATVCMVGAFSALLFSVPAAFVAVFCIAALASLVVALER